MLLRTDSMVVSMSVSKSAASAVLFAPWILWAASKLLTTASVSREHKRSIVTSEGATSILMSEDAMATVWLVTM